MNHKMPSKPKICFACSGGGHLRQMMMLVNLASEFEHYFLTVERVTPHSTQTQESELPESIEQQHRFLFVPDIAMGLLRHSPKAWVALIKNIFSSLNSLLQEHPDLILSEGAGAAIATLLLGRLLGAKTVFIETIAHTHTPSLAGKTVAPFVNAHLVQWEGLCRLYPKAILVKPVVATGKPLPLKVGLPPRVLVTVGTHGPFDRLIREVEKLIGAGVIQAPVTAQVGPGGYHSPAMRCFETCEQAEMQRLLNEATILITHAGTGSIFTGIKARCQVIAITRQSALGEHYDDHQLEILNEMVGCQAILGGQDPADLAQLYRALPEFTPQEIVVSVEPIEQEVRRLIKKWFEV
jgi:UDP-N-acetylglucosamine transferase subunit ALG13